MATTPKPSRRPPGTYDHWGRIPRPVLNNHDQAREHREMERWVARRHCVGGHQCNGTRWSCTEAERRARMRTAYGRRRR